MYSDEHLEKENMKNVTSGFGLEPDPESLRTTENDPGDIIAETDEILLHDETDIQDDENRESPDTENVTEEKNPGIHTPKTPKKSRKKNKRKLLKKRVRKKSR